MLFLEKTNMDVYFHDDLIGQNVAETSVVDACCCNMPGSKIFPFYSPSVSVITVSRACSIVAGNTGPLRNCLEFWTIRSWSYGVSKETKMMQKNTH